jgi:hypothetical protein
LSRRIIEVIDLQSNNDWNAKYQELVYAKIARLNALKREELKGFRGEWSSLVEDVRGMLTDDPAGPRAQELAARWVDLLGRLMGGPVDRSMMGAGGAYQAARAWRPSEADQRVWDFMQRGLVHR